MHRNDEPDLPNEFMVDCYTVDYDWEELDDDEKSDAISDYLTDEYEYCHNGFRFEQTDIRTIHVYDIQWDTEE